jgi:HTH-type transcriptional regulator/antitoxin HigA
MDIHPIRNDRDHAKALVQIEKLWGAAAGTPESDALEVLVTLVDAYEAKHHPIDPPDPIEAIKFRMEQEGLSRADLEPMIGSRARVSEVMTRRRSLTIPMINNLRATLGISGDVLLGRLSAKAGRRRTGRALAAKAKLGGNIRLRKKTSPARDSRVPARGHHAG